MADVVFITTEDGAQITWGDSPLVWADTSDADAMLAPLLASHEANGIETDMKAAFVKAFYDLISDQATRVNSFGVPHRAVFSVLERFVKADGLVIDQRPGREEHMREVYRAWRARNPKRGLHFLRFYLRLLYPGTASVEQLWQDPAKPYPLGAVPAEAPGYFLTSRVRVSLAAEASPTVSDMAQLRALFLAVLPARMVLEMFVKIVPDSPVGMLAGAAMHMAQHFTFTDA